MPHYSVMKAAVLSLSRLVADLYARGGHPLQRGGAGTDDDGDLAGGRGLADQLGDDREAVFAKVAAGRPLGRMGTPARLPP